MLEKMVADSGEEKEMDVTGRKRNAHKDKMGYTWRIREICRS